MIHEKMCFEREPDPNKRTNKRNAEAGREGKAKEEEEGGKAGGREKEGERGKHRREEKESRSTQYGERVEPAAASLMMAIAIALYAHGCHVSYTVLHVTWSHRW